MIEAAETHGQGRVAVEDTLNGALSYKRLLIGAAVLGTKLMPLAPEGRALGVMLPNANGAAVTILGLMSAGRVRLCRLVRRPSVCRAPPRRRPFGPCGGRRDR